MPKVRYVKTPEQVAAAQQNNPEFMSSTVRSIRAVYETDEAIARAVLPKPLELVRPEVCVTFSEVAIQITPDYTFEIGSCIFGVRARYEDAEGIYLITMPMTTEQAVVPGRETFGEPKKIAEIEFSRDGDAVHSKVSRMGMTYLEGSGTLGEEMGPRKFTEYGFCYKAMPSCNEDKDFDNDPLLVRLEWRHDQTNTWKVNNPSIVLTESPFDPVVDIPIKRLVSCEYEEGSTQSNGRVLRSVPGEWLLPFLHQRYDDSSGEGAEIETAA
jgi:acetoacetate decarboxylase